MGISLDTIIRPSWHYLGAPEASETEGKLHWHKQSNLETEQHFQITEWHAGEKNNVLLQNTNCMHCVLVHNWNVSSVYI